jgi:hypothetical protein
MSRYHGPKIIMDGLKAYLDSTVDSSYIQNITYGPELVTDASVLTAGDGQVKTISSLGGNYINFLNIAPSIAGKRYKIEWIVSARRGTTSASFGPSTALLQGVMNQSPGRYIQTFTSNVTSNFSIGADNVGTDFDIDYLSIKEVLTPNSDIWYDVSGNNNHFNIGGAVYSDKSLLFNGGSSNAYEIVANSVPITGDFTFEFFCKPTLLQNSISCAGVFNCTLFSKGGASNDIYRGFFVIWTTISSVVNLSMYVGTSNANLNLNVPYTKSANQPAHITAVYKYERESNTPSIYFYLDGVLLASNYSLNGGPLDTSWINSQPLRIGGRQNHCPYSSFFGNLYTFRYYNRALSANEILYNFNLSKSRFGL